ncbi:hypothetical protein ACFLQU_00225 [Verrucomicrobiota bacterium]
METDIDKPKTRVEAPKKRAAPAQKPARKLAPEPSGSQSFLAVTAKAAAGAGLGLVVVLVGAAAGGIIAETVLIPSLLAKIAAGVAGGGVGLAKGIGDERRPR